MEQGYEVRIYPNAAQRVQIDRTLGCARWVYNKALEVRKAAWETDGTSLSTNDVVRMIPTWKREHPWLAEVDAVALQQAVRDLGRAYDNFFRRCNVGGSPRFPRFKTKHERRQSYRTQNPRGRDTVSVLDSRHVKLPKLGSVKARVSMGVEGRITSATVKRTPAGKYFVVLCCADVPRPSMPAGSVDVMGVDAGIKDMAVRSDGVRVTNPRSLAKAERGLAREQRRLSRKQKGSKNREKQRVKVARCHEKVANRRKDALHKATTDIIRESQAVAVEDLNVRGMMANHHLAKAVSDASMGELRRQLRYKAAWYGRGYVEVSRWFPSSKLCSACGCVFDGLTLSMREWECPECGTRHDRDLDAARNIAAEGRRILKEGTAGHAGTAA